MCFWFSSLYRDNTGHSLWRGDNPCCLIILSLAGKCFRSYYFIFVLQHLVFKTKHFFFYEFVLYMLP